MPQEKPLCSVTVGAIETIARHLRNLPCDNSVVAMDLHRIARDLEAIVSGSRVAEVGAAIRLEVSHLATPTLWSAQECRE